jgi:Kelch motif
MRRGRACLACLTHVGVALLLAGCGGHTAHASPAPRRSSGSASTPGRSQNAFVPHRATAHVAAWHLPVASARQALVPLGQGQVVVAGGLLAGDVTTGRVSVVDLATGRTRAGPQLAVPVHDAAGGLDDGVPVVVGGGNATEQDVVQALRGRAWQVVAHLATPRSDLSTVPDAGALLVVGGYDGSGTPTMLGRLSPDGSVDAHGRLRRGVRYAATAVLGRTAYVFGGEVDGRELGDVQAVELRTGVTREAGRLPVPLGHAMAATVGRRILVMGGRVGPDLQTPKMWWFDPTTGRFTPAGSLPVALSDAAVATVGHRVWLLGGETPGVTDQVELVKVR